MRPPTLLLACAVATLAVPALCQQPKVRLKQLVDLHEIRENTLTGRGLVVGLKGSGDGTPATRAMVVNFLTRMNLKVRADQVASGNVALVHLTAKLRPFSRHGTRLDVHVNSIGEATSLRGGTLLLTELRSGGQVYATASGPLVIGGFEAKGNNAKITRNHPTSGLIPNGGICEPPVEELVPRLLDEKGYLSFSLRHPSAMTATRAEAAINELLKRKNCGFARTVDHGQVRIHLIDAYRSRDAVTSLLAEIEALEIEPDTDARIILDEKTGTIIVGKGVRLDPCVVQISDLTIEVVDEEEVSQPLPGINRGKTEKVGRTSITVTQESGKPVKLGGGASLMDLIQGLQSLRIDSQKMMTVLTQLERAGFLHGDIQ